MSDNDGRQRRCATLFAELSDYIDGELAEAERARLERHVVECACCGRMAEELRAIVDWCRTSAGPRIPREVRARARARVAALLARAPGRSDGSNVAAPTRSAAPSRRHRR
jgi:anti-sigma factor RsiW